MKYRMTMAALIMGLSIYSLAQNRASSQRFNALKVKTPHLAQVKDCAEEIPSTTISFHHEARR